MPAGFGDVRIPALQLRLEQIDLVLDLIGVDHGEVGVVIVPMAGDTAVVVNQRIQMLALPMVDGGVKQRVQSVALAGGHRDHRDAQHLRQTVGVQLHAPLLDDVHHVQGHDHRLAQLQQLEGQIEAPLQGGGVHHVDDHIHLVREDKLTGDLFLHGVRGEAVGARQIHQPDVQILVVDGPLHLLHRDAGPVGHLQVGAGIGVEKGGLAAVGIADESNRHILFHGSSRLTSIFLVML